MINKKTQSRNQSVLNKINKDSIFFLNNQAQDTFYNTSAFKMFLKQNPIKIKLKQPSNNNRFLLPSLCSKLQLQQNISSLSILRNKNSEGLKKIIKNIQSQQIEHDDRNQSMQLQTSKSTSEKPENTKRVHSIGPQKQHYLKKFSKSQTKTTQISQLCKTLEISSKRANMEDKQKANTSQLNRKFKNKDNLLLKYKVNNRFKQQINNSNLIKKNRSEMSMSPWPTKYDHSFIGDSYDIRNDYKIKH